MLRSILAHPLTRGRSIDDPVTTELRRSIVTSKPFLRAIYEDWYRAILERLPICEGSVLELGSGAGFFQQFVPDVITSKSSSARVSSSSLMRGASHSRPASFARSS